MFLERKVPVESQNELIHLPDLVQQPSKLITFVCGSINFSNSNSATRSFFAEGLSFSKNINFYFEEITYMFKIRWNSN